MADNQFSVKVPSIYEALMAGDKGYDTGRQFQQDQALRAAGPDLASGNYQGALAKLIQSGNLHGALAISQLGNNNRDFQFRQQEAARAQGNTDRSFGLQKQQADEAARGFDYREIDDGNGNKVLVKINKSTGQIDKPTINGAPAVASNPFSYGKMNENESKDSGYANRMFEAEKVLRDPAIIKAATSLGQRALDKIPVAGNYLTNDAYQKYDQATRNFVNAVLRRESGAAISQSEFDNAYKQYFPQPGDTEQRIAQKQKNRQDTLAAIAGGGGRNYKPPYSFGQNGELIPTGNGKQGSVAQTAPEATPTQTAAAPPMWTDPTTNKTYKIINGIPHE